MITAAVPMYLYAINNISSLQKDKEYLAEAVSRAEQDINELETTVATIKDTVFKLDKEMSVHRTQTNYLIQKNGEGIKRLQDTLNEIMKLIANKN